MSTTACFYAFRSEDVDSLIDASRPEEQVARRRVLFITRTHGQTIDRFWPFVDRHGHELECFTASGNAFMELSLVLEDCAVVGLFQLGSPGLTQILHSGVRDFAQLFDSEAAEVALSTLRDADLSPDVIRAHCQEERADDFGGCVNAVSAACDMLQTWLMQVASGKVGLLWVG